MCQVAHTSALCTPYPKQKSRRQKTKYDCFPSINTINYYEFTLQTELISNEEPMKMELSTETRLKIIIKIVQYINKLLALMPRNRHIAKCVNLKELARKQHTGKTRTKSMKRSKYMKTSNSSRKRVIHTAASRWAAWGRRILPP